MRIYLSVMGIVSLLSSLLVLTSVAEIPKIDKIKLQQVKMTGSPYRWGEGTGKTSDQAKEAALNDLVTRIQTTVLVFNSREIQETRSRFKENTTINTNQFSFLRLRGLEYIQIAEEKRSSTWLAYIHNDSLAASFELQKQKIRGLVNEAKHAEAELRISDALRSYYWASLLTRTTIDTLALEIDGRITTDPYLTLTEQLQKMTQQVKITKADCGQTSGTILIDLLMTYKGQPIKNMDYLYFDGYGDCFGEVRNGHDLAVLNVTAKSPVYTFAIRIRYDYPEKMRCHPDINGLYEAFRDDLPDLIVKKTLHFPWITEEVVVKEPKPEPESVPDGKVSPPKRKVYPVPVEVLSYLKPTNEFMEALTEYEKGKRLIVEKQDWQKLKDRGYDIYLAVVGREELQGVFSYDGDTYTNVRSKRTYKSVKKDFKGFYIWMGVIEQGQ